MKIYKNSMNIRKTYFTTKAQQIDICHNLKICYVWLLLSVNPRHMQTTYIEMENHLPCSFFCLTPLVTSWTQSTRRTRPVMRARLPRAMARLNLSPASRRLCWRQELPDARKRTPPTRHSKHSCSRTVSYYIGLQLKCFPKYYRPWLQKSQLRLNLI